MIREQLAKRKRRLSDKAKAPAAPKATKAPAAPKAPKTPKAPATRTVPKEPVVDPREIDGPVKD